MDIKYILKASKVGNQRGAALVEFAIVLPLLLVLIFGMVEFGLVLFNKQVITNASREGARAGIVSAVSRLSHDDIVQIVEKYVADNLITFSDDKDPVVETSRAQYTGDVNTYTDSYGSFVIFTGSGAPAAKFRDILRVEVTFDYEFLVIGQLLSILPGGGDNGWGTLTLEAVTLMKYE